MPQPLRSALADRPQREPKGAGGGGGGGGDGGAVATVREGWLELMHKCSAHLFGTYHELMCLDPARPADVVAAPKEDDAAALKKGEVRRRDLSTGDPNELMLLLDYLLRLSSPLAGGAETRHGQPAYTTKAARELARRRGIRRVTAV